MAQNQEKAFQCPACPGKSFLTAKALHDHSLMKQHWHCQQCSRYFATSEALQQHNEDSSQHKQPPNRPRKHHDQPRAGKSWPCQQCDRTFGTREALEQHRRDSKGHGQHRAAPNWTHPTAVLVAVPARDGPHTGAIGPTAAVPVPLTPEQQLSLRRAAQSLAEQSALVATQEPPRPTPLVHRGITYTTLTIPEQMALQSLLLRSCHSPARLALEGYPLAASATCRTTTPPRDPSCPKRAAVVLDCEMAGTTDGDHAITLSLVDFFTGAALVHALVKPASGIKITNWRTNITGVTPGAMAVAVARGEALRGRDAATARLLDFVDADTVVVGHSVKYDLKVLGLAHNRIVDSAILAAEASGRFGSGEDGNSGGGQKAIKQGVALERLCRELTGVRIRGGGGVAAGPGGRSQHDSLEDVLATREVVIWCLTHPVELRAWAAKNWEVQDGAKGNKGGAKGSKGDRDRTTKHRPESVEDDFEWDEDDDDDDDGEMLRWEDVIDYDTWPKSPPDWSD